MATEILSITVETEMLNDAIDELREIHTRLARRHGEQFRALDRMIEECLAKDMSSFFRVHWIEKTLGVLAPAGELARILRKARELKVIS